MLEKRKANNKDNEVVVNNKSLNEEAKSYNLMDNFGGLVLSKWQNKSDNMNQSKSTKSRVNDIIDPSLSSGVMSFANEAADRLKKLDSKLSDDFLTKQFRGSQILTDSERVEGKIC